MIISEIIFHDFSEICNHQKLDVSKDTYALVTLKNRSRSVIVELVRGLTGMHVWVKLEEARPKTVRVILMTTVWMDTGLTDGKSDPICSSLGA